MLHVAASTPKPNYAIISKTTPRSKKAMLKPIITLLLGTLTLLSSYCTLDITPNRVDIFCKDKSLDLLVEHDHGKLTTVTDSVQTTRFTYDKEGNIEK